MAIYIIAGALITYALGTTMGHESGKKAAIAEQVVPEKSPEVWPPSKHKEFLKTCALACGEGNMQEYNVMYGKCICKGDKK
jgi:hypothetical protein